MRPKPTIRLVITDLDNTLYDWVKYFSSSIFAMVEEASRTLGVSAGELVEDLQRVHRRHRNTEHPFALLETDAAKLAFRRASRSARATELKTSFEIFRRARAETLCLYPKVVDVLEVLRAKRIPVVAHTDAHAVNAAFRLKWLGVARYVDAIYAPSGALPPHPDASREGTLDDVMAKVRPLSQCERKPQPRTLLRICADYGVSSSEAVYVGDSLARDVAMARAAGAWSAWARYGTGVDPAMLDLIKPITHWTPDEVNREKNVLHHFPDTGPDVSLDSIEGLLDAFAFEARSELRVAA